MELLAWVLLALVSLITVRNSTFKPPPQGHKTSSWLPWTLPWYGCCKGRCCNRRSTAVDAEVCPHGCQAQDETMTSAQTCEKTSIPSTFIQQSKQLQGMRHIHPAFSASLHKPPLRSTASEVHLWQSHMGPQDTFPPSGSRPSSIMFCDAGFIRFKNPDPQVTTEPSIDSFEICGSHKNTKELKLLQKADQIKSRPEICQEALHYSVVETEDNSHKPLERLHSDRRLKRLQNSLNVYERSEITSDGQRSEGEGEEGASITEDGCSSEEAASTGAGGNGGGDVLDWSKYTSTCSSSVSAANSFDIRMYDDSDVAYYQIPFSVYNSLHQHSPPPPTVPPPPPPLPHRTQQNTPPANIPERVYEPAQKKDKLRTVLQGSRASPPTCEVSCDFPVTCPQHPPSCGSPDLVASATHTPCPHHVKWDSTREVVDPQWSYIRPPGSMCPSESVSKGPEMDSVSYNIQNSVHVFVKGIKHTDDAPENSCFLPPSPQVNQLDSRCLTQAGRAIENSQSTQQIPGPYYMLPEKIDLGQQTSRLHRRRSSRRESDRVRPCGHLPSTASANTNRKDSIKQTNNNKNQNTPSKQNSPTVSSATPTVLPPVLQQQQHQHQQKEASPQHQILDIEKDQRESRKQYRVLEKNLKNVTHHSLHNNYQECLTQRQQANKQHHISEKGKTTKPQEEQVLTVPLEPPQHLQEGIVLHRYSSDKLQDPQSQNLEEKCENLSQQQTVEVAACRTSAITQSDVNSLASSTSSVLSHPGSSEGLNTDFTGSSVVPSSCAEISKEEQPDSHSGLTSEDISQPAGVPADEPFENHRAKKPDACKTRQQVCSAVPDIPPRKMYGLPQSPSGSQVRDP